MNDLISRQEAVDWVDGLKRPETVRETSAEAIYRVAWNTALNCVLAYLMTAEPGRSGDGWKYCPVCGAKMEEDR